MCTHKDVDEGHLRAVKLVLELEDLMGELDFRRIGYDEVIFTISFDLMYLSYTEKDGSLCHLQEIKELESQVQNETVVLQDNGTRSLDMDKIVESFKNQYANMAARSREDVENWNKKKVRERT